MDQNREATKRRSVASTNLNRASSRSHAILTLDLTRLVGGKGDIEVFAENALAESALQKSLASYYSLTWPVQRTTR